MEMLGDHNKRLEQYDNFITGPDAIQKLEFIDNDHYYAVNVNEVGILFVKRFFLLRQNQSNQINIFPLS